MFRFISTIRGLFTHDCSANHRGIPWLALLLAGALALAGCEGDTGPQGAQGEAGQDGVDGASATLLDVADPLVTEINAEITGVMIASPPVMEFNLSDSRGNGLTGLTGADISFTIAKLEDGTNGDPSFWQSYVNQVESPEGVGPGTEDKTQATTESFFGGNQGTLIDNGDGSYTYTYGTDVMNVTDPIAVAYDASLTHRVGFEIRGLTEVASPSYTFRPSDGATTGIFSRSMVNDDTCNACHNNLALHGGARNTTDYCVTCHNPGSTDANSGNTVDMTQMIHKIHAGSSLPTIAGATADARYSIFGYRNSEHIYADYDATGDELSGVIFPQDLRNCRNCHDETDPTTPDAGNWIAKPTIEACGACHDNVNFATGENHFSGAPSVTNADCQSCHGKGQFAAADEVHRILEWEAAENFQYNVIGVTNAGPGLMPTINFSITNPNDGDSIYDLTGDAFTQPGTSRIAVLIAWDTEDYSNTGSGSEVPGFRPGSAAQVVSLDPLGGNATVETDGTYSITSGVALPDPFEGSIGVALEGHPAVEIDGAFEQIPVTGAVGYFAVTGDVIERREVADIVSCNNCHAKLSLHGGNRTDSIPLCVTCHNPNATDIRARVEGSVDATTSGDGKKEEVIDFKYMVHAIHAGETLIYGFGGGEHDYRHVEFPGIKNECTNCHEGDTFYPVDQNDVLATTIDTGALLGDPTDDVNMSPTASACWGCHQSEDITEASTPDSAKAHMIQNGASFNATQAADGTLTDNDTNGVVFESCQVCHGEGRDADVAAAHGVE
jgi:OmcA/MtrC family decaheme c-type cytochrome